MDQKTWQDAYRRAAQAAPVRVDRRMRDILCGDVPTFMELPHARPFHHTCACAQCR